MRNSRNCNGVNNYSHIVFQDNDVDIRHKSQKKNEKNSDESCIAKRRDKN